MYCLSVWNGFKDHRAHKKTALTRCFPKASAKVVLFFIPANYLEIFFEKSREKIKHTGKICAIKLFPGLNPTKKTANRIAVFEKANVSAKTNQLPIARLK